MTAFNELQTLQSELKSQFIERDEIIDGVIIALLAGEHVLLLGPVGTAKSMLARAICDRLEGAQLFSWLLTKFSTPEEIFGPVSLKGLEADEFRRLTADKLPTAHIAFLDEIFKANSAILNSLLSLLNERIYHNGRQAEPVPLLSVIGASNELPEEGELVALYDRFLLRFQLGYVEDDTAFLKLLSLDEPAKPNAQLKLETLIELQQAVSAVNVPKSVLSDIAALRANLWSQEVEVSDRRYRKAVDLLKAHAFLYGRTSVDGRDLAFLDNILWTEAEDRQVVEEAIRDIGQRFQQQTTALRQKAQEQQQYATRYWPTEEARLSAAVESLEKLRGLLSDADSLISLSEGRDDGVVELVEATRVEIGEIVESLLHHVGSQKQ